MNQVGNVFWLLILDEKLKELQIQKEALERDVENAIQHLRHMNEIEKQAKEVNQYSRTQDLQEELEQKIQSIEKIEQETSQLRTKMEDNRTKIQSFYEAFVNLKTDILEMKTEKLIWLRILLSSLPKLAVMVVIFLFSGQQGEDAFPDFPAGFRHLHNAHDPFYVAAGKACPYHFTTFRGS